MKTRWIHMVVLVAALVLTGCASQGSAADIDPAAAAAALVENGGIEGADSLVAIPENLLDSYYAMDDAVAEYAIYIDGSGGTAREVAVLKCADAKDAPKLKEVLETRLATLKREFENYRPDEMKKIQNPVLITRDNMVYMVLSDDPQKAEQAVHALYQE